MKLCLSILLEIIVEDVKYVHIVWQLHFDKVSFVVNL